MKNTDKFILELIGLLFFLLISENDLVRRVLDEVSEHSINDSAHF